MRITFEQWLAKVDQWLEAHVFVSSADLPDCCYADWFADGISPARAARMALKAMDGDAYD